MKKLLIALAIVLAVGLTANAQRDNFFNDWDDVSNGLDKINTFDNLDRAGGPEFPGHGGGDTPAPLGSGIVILTALGAGYALARKREE